MYMHCVCMYMCGFVQPAMMFLLFSEFVTISMFLTHCVANFQASDYRQLVQRLSCVHGMVTCFYESLELTKA